MRRLARSGAGLTAALVLAASPAVVALNRGNISDSLMILLVVLAADAVAGAVRDGGQGRLVLAGFWVGLAFQAKMIEAWLVLPALGFAYLVAGPGPRGQRVRHVVVGGATAAMVSLGWVVPVTLVPASDRPYVDGSRNDSLFEQVFVYNGFGRFGDQSPLQVLAGQGLALPVPRTLPGWDRLLTGDLGRDIGWLLPLALTVAIAGILACRRRSRTDPVRAGYLLWGAWTVVLAVAFSLISTINSYYTAALAPAVAALFGIGFSVVPAVASVLLVVRGWGAFDTPFESTRTAAGIDELFVVTPRMVARALPSLEKARAGAPDLLAVQSSAVASVFGYSSGEEVLPIGGFTGTMLQPTLAQLRDKVARGEFHLVLTFPSTDPRLLWIAQHCRHLQGSVPPFLSYYCVPADAGTG